MIFRRKSKEEKRRIVLAVDLNTNPVGLLKGLWYLAIGLIFIAWGVVIGAMFLYVVSVLFVILVLYEGLELRGRNKSLRGWVYIMLVGTMFFESFIFSSNYILFVVGAYLSAVFGVFYPWKKVREEMEESEDVKEVFTDGYLGQ